jgi:ribosomal-protein-alanine N-acetyltransferase
VTASHAPTPVLEPMRWQDIPAVVALEEQLFPGDSPWHAAMFWSELAAGRHYLVHRDEVGAVDGYAGLALSDGGAPGSAAPDPDDFGDVHTIGVRADRQGRGLGRALLRALLAAAADRRVLLDVRTDNEPAIALYASEGFAVVGRRRRYYQPSGADAYAMERPGSRP